MSELEKAIQFLYNDALDHGKSEQFFTTEECDECGEDIPVGNYFVYNISFTNMDKHLIKFHKTLDDHQFEADILRVYREQATPKDNSSKKDRTERKTQRNKERKTARNDKYQ